MSLLDRLEHGYGELVAREDARLQRARREAARVAVDASEHVAARQAVHADQRFLRRLEGRRHDHEHEEGWMPAKDPDPGLDPLMLQHRRNIAVRGGFEHTGQAAEMLERERAAQARAPIPGGGTRWHRSHDPEEPDMLIDPDARLRALRGDSR